MSTFFENSFSTPSFSPDAFDVATTVQVGTCSWGKAWSRTWDRNWGACEEETSDARSGYWRLFFMQMQEEALSEKDAVATNIVPTAEQQKVSVEQKPLVKKKVKLPPLVKLEKYEKPDFKRKPIYAASEPISTEFPLWLTSISLEIDSWVSSIIPLWKEHKQVIIEKREAANDADIRLRLLLLAA